MHNLIFIKILLLFGICGSLADGKGLSKKKQVDKFNSRLSDFVEEEQVPCELPPITHRLPSRIRAKIELIWKDVDPVNDKNCWIEMARTRNVLLRLTSKERSEILKSGNGCKMPSVIDALPSNYQRRIKDIWSRTASEKSKQTCWQLQKRTRMLLINMPMNLKRRFHPPAFECALPHFFNRLEKELQEKLQNVWKGYKAGQPCVEQIDQQIQLLEANDISLKSFQMPPPAMFKKRDILKKLRRHARVA